jgi:hypothetical protein
MTTIVLSADNMELSAYKDTVLPADNMVLSAGNMVSLVDNMMLLAEIIGQVFSWRYDNYQHDAVLSAAIANNMFSGFYQLITWCHQLITI